MNKLKHFLFLVSCGMLLTACATQERNILPESSELEENVESNSSSSTEYQESIVVQGNDAFAIAETGEIVFPDIEVTELSYCLPGYYWNGLDCASYESELCSIIETMSSIQNKPQSRKYSMQDGGAVRISGIMDDEDVTITLIPMSAFG